MITLNDVSKKIVFYDTDGNLTDYDANNPPSPMPHIEKFYVQVSWANKEPYLIGAWWSDIDIENTILGDLNIFNKPPQLPNI